MIGFCGLTVPTLSASSPDIPVATFTAEDYGFDGPDVLPAGMLVVRLANRGSEPHHIQLLRLENGKSPEDLKAALQGPLLTIPPGPSEWVDQTELNPGKKARRLST